MMSDGLLVAGIDVGSASIKAVVYEDDGGGRVLASRAEKIRRRDPMKVSMSIFEDCLAEAGIPRDRLAYVATPIVEPEASVAAKR